MEMIFISQRREPGIILPETRPMQPFSSHPSVMSPASDPVLNQPELNRTIWIFWSQGFDNAPDVVRVCLRSWKHHNPGWRVVELSDASLSQYMDAQSLSRIRGVRNLPVQKLANLIRLYLISRHGGVWADATCFCCKPLDDWLHACMDSGFFAFRLAGDKWLRNPRNRGLRRFKRTNLNRIVASWFLASVRNNPLSALFFERHLELFTNNSFARQGSSTGTGLLRLLGRVLNRNAGVARLWAHPLVTRMAGVYPYFIVHYHFARLVDTNEVCRDIWSRTPVFLARDLTRLDRAVVSPVNARLMAYMRDPGIPMHKLRWKYRHEDFREGCVLDYLARSLT